MRIGERGGGTAHGKELFCRGRDGAGRRVAYREKSVAEWRPERRDGAGRRAAWNGAGVRNNGAWTACCGL